MQADDDVPSFQQLVEHAEALQHDVEQAEHHRQADDDGDPYDAAERDAAIYLRRHTNVLGVRLVFDDRTVFLDQRNDYIVVVTAGDGGEIRRIPLGPSGDRGS